MRKLRHKFLAYVLTPVVLIITLTGLISFAVALRILEKQLLELGTIRLQQAADELDAELASGIETLQVMAVQKGMARVSDADLTDILSEMTRQFPVESVFMAYLDGKFLTSIGKERIPENFDARLLDWYRAALESPTAVVSAPHNSPFTSEPLVTVAQKVLDRDAAVRGVLGYNLPLAAIRKRLPRIRLLEDCKDCVFSIFLRDGTYVIHSDPRKIGRKIGESRGELHVKMRQALGEDSLDWKDMATIGGDFWYGGFRKSRRADLYVALEVPLWAASRPIRVLGVAYLALGLGSIVVLSVVLLKMAGKIAQPVNMLSGAAVRVSKGDYDLNLPVTTEDELGHLVSAFNTMAQGLRQRDFIRDTFGRYLTQEVVDRLLESDDGLRLGGEKREISIIMSDLRGFTAHTSQMAPEQVLYLLNRYLGKMVEILLDNGAIVDEMQGDGILAILGAPVSMEDHPARAIACALMMQQAMESLNYRNEVDGLPHMEMGIGVNTGNVVVGNMGSERRTKYGVVGAAVNFTGRIESFAVGGQVLISRSTYERVRNTISVRDVIRIEMKGIPGPVHLYDVRGIGDPYNVTLQETIEAPRPLTSSIPVRIYHVAENVVSPAEGDAWITHLSENSGRIKSLGALKSFEEIRLELWRDEKDVSSGEGFARVVSVKTEGDSFMAEIRFTFLSPEIRRVFRRELITGSPGFQSS